MMDVATYKAQVCERLRVAMEANGLTSYTMAKQFKLSPSQVSNWIAGRYFPDQFFIYLFCNRYSVTADWIYRGLVASAMPKALADSLWESSEAGPGELPERGHRIGEKV